MIKKRFSVKKYLVSTVVVTALAFSPIVAGSVFAHGGPDAEAKQNNSTTETTETANTKTPTGNVTVISIGDSGKNVENVQTALTEHGYQANPDGIFGPETDEAVRAFQQDQLLAVDGIAGPDTNAALSVTSDTGSEDLTIVEAPDEQTKSEAIENSDVVSIAESLLGSPYKFGGTTPSGFDSSGFVNYVFDEVGIDLDRTHADMWVNNGVHVDSPSIGDVVFFENTYQDGISHSGIYIGNNEMIHAGTEETGVEITSLSYDYWQDHYVGAKSFN